MIDMMTELNPPDVSERRSSFARISPMTSGEPKRRGLAMTNEERDAKLIRMEQMLSALLERQQVKEFYEIDEFATLVGKASFTVREWCRLGRINGKKRRSGRGASSAWVIAHDEPLRYRRDGLLSTVPVESR
jgi:hypothetical protein